ncbi:very-long-chain 3-oxoacyl-CoA reductase-like protein At1g24470 [Prosopis cineraria]|uniref:very-long-chain 3-oxoacyl-CoA reductase-like protein At1g24470 n=1 Tax=Prosopis cineraria TaxID=364024 RepID=UPI002410A4A4|nr:very-long-chain 3-oxoacyl-CoA reductase-like protein At1g24470 [Prosopis cineraria]
MGLRVLACSDLFQWLLLTITICLGFCVVLKQSLSFLRWIFRTFLRSEKDLIKSYGSWALVTGATDGIGEAFAYGLARRGLNLVLVSRSSDKLRTISDEIRAEFPNCNIRTVEIDLAGDTAGGIKRLKAAIEGVADLGILVNNVGITYPEAMYFHEVKEEVWMRIVKVNVEATTAVTKAVVEGMIKRRRGAVVNIGSGAGIVVPSHPLYAIYAATKAYVRQFSKCLHVEYGHYGIHVQCQVPLYVATKMVARVAAIEKPSLWIASAEKYAEAGIRSIGYEAECSPYWPHSLQCYLASFLPHSSLTRGVSMLLFVETPAFITNITS